MRALYQEEARTVPVADDNQVYYTFGVPERYGMIGAGRFFSSYENRLADGFHMAGKNSLFPKEVSA